VNEGKAGDRYLEILRLVPTIRGWS
jgi:hypothetical protein